MKISSKEKLNLSQIISFVMESDAQSTGRFPARRAGRPLAVPLQRHLQLGILRKAVSSTG